jgi:RNA polymerase sigma factor (sigma-70 family)
VTTSTADDTELWHRVLANDATAYAELFDRHSARVYRRALGQLGNVHDAEDVTAGAFLELWRKHRSVTLVAGSVLPWLLVTVVNLGRNQVRGLARYRAAISAIPRTESAVDPADIVADQLDGSPIAQTVARLGRVDAALLVLTAVEGFTTAEAAAALGITPGAARMRLSRARTRVRELHNHPLHTITEGDAS